MRRGSYRIGTVAMASPRDKKVLLTRELLTLRVANKKNRYGLTPFNLLAVLSSDEVQKQVPYLVFVDTTLPNIGDRWKYLMLPLRKNLQDMNSISDEVEKIIRQKWNAQENVDQLRNKYGGLVT